MQRLFKKNVRHSKSLHGSALALTILTLAAISTVSLGLATVVPADFRQSTALEQTLNAENSAWSGVEHALLLLRQNREKNKFFEISDEMVSSGGSDLPAGFYERPTNTAEDCYLNRNVCPGLDRFLGNLINGSPVMMNTLNSPDTYGITVWHRRDRVGNPEYLDDLTSIQNTAIDPANINPYLPLNEVKRIDVHNAQSVHIKWKPIPFTDPGGPFNPSSGRRCMAGSGNNSFGIRFYVLFTLMGEDGNLVNGDAGRKLQEGQNIPGHVNQATISVSNGDATTLSMRFFATVSSPSNSNEIAHCYIRYSVEPLGAASETVDLGVDVVEAVGVSGDVKRKLRVLVNRENSQPENIFDFGIFCSTCTPLN